MPSLHFYTLTALLFPGSILGFAGVKSYEDDLPQCHMNGTESCALASMKSNTGNYIYPDRSTTADSPTGCLAGNPYRFYVQRGTSLDNVLIYFQGGGGCWNKLTSRNKRFRMCHHEASHSNIDKGIFEKRDDNPFKDYTVIHILYCSGDTHLGNKKRDYKDKTTGRHVQLYGSGNTRSVFKWMHQQLPFGKKYIMIGGSSAGAMATQFYAQYLLSNFPSERQGVLIDSLIGIIPKKNTAHHWKKLGVCDGFGLEWNSTFVKDCHEGKFKPSMALEATIKNHPKAQFLAINTKIDYVQRVFYALTSYNHLGREEFYNDMIGLLLQFEKYPNFASYLVRGGAHQFLNKKIVYTATTSRYHGPLVSKWEKTKNFIIGADRAPVQVVTLLKVLKSMTQGDPEEIYRDDQGFLLSYCYGEIRDSKFKLFETDECPWDLTEGKVNEKSLMTRPVNLASIAEDLM